MKFLFPKIILTIILLASCQKSDKLDMIKGDFSGSPSANEVWIQGMAFIPSTITVKTGTTVNFINKDFREHTVTADDNSFDSGPLAPGKSYSRTFTSGVTSYHCITHPDMKGSVIVK